MALENIDYGQITVGQPTEGGCVFLSFDMNKTPTDATTKMSTVTGFESLGDISENGFTISTSRTTNDFKDWNGDTVLTAVSEEKTQFKIEFLETSRPAVAKLRYGKENVAAGTDGSVATMKSYVGTQQYFSMVIDELESNGWLRRTCIPKCTIDSFDDETHQKGSLLVYGMTITALKTNDPLFTVYRAKPATA